MSKNKSFSGGISERYALALFELSNEAKKTDEYVSILSSFMKIYNSDDKLKNYIKNPTNTNQNQKEVFDKILNIGQLTGPIISAYLSIDKFLFIF